MSKEYSVPNLNEDSSLRIGNFRLKEILYGSAAAISLLAAIFFFILLKIWVGIFLNILFFTLLWFAINSYKMYESAIEGLDSYLLAKLMYRLTKKPYEIMLYSGEE